MTNLEILEKLDEIEENVGELKFCLVCELTNEIDHILSDINMLSHTLKKGEEQTNPTVMAFGKEIK